MISQAGVQGNRVRFTLVLIVARNRSEQVLSDRFGGVDQLTIVVDRRYRERRAQQNPRVALERRRTDRRKRTWAALAIAAEGMALVRR